MQSLDSTFHSFKLSSDAKSWLRAVRIGFMLQAATLVVGFAISAFLIGQVDVPASAEAEIAFAQQERLAHIGVFLIAELPAMWLLYANARSARWQQAIFGLGFVRLINLGLSLMIVANLVPMSPIVAHPISVLVWHSRIWLGWLDCWCMAVVLAEFAVYCKVEKIVKLTEGLGKLMVVGVVANALLSAWAIPRGFPPFVDDFTALIVIVTCALIVTANVWVFIILTLASTAARLLIEKVDRAGADVSPTEAV